MTRILLVMTMVILGVSAASAPSADPPLKWAIAIHGGAGVSETLASDARAVERKEYENALQAALAVGSDVLSQGGTALDAVEKVIRAMENDPHFNAGKGACYNAVGKHELDASIMDGKTLACGAVAGVRTVKNPISLARLVMSKTRHVLFTGDGAEEFATSMGVERVENSWFDTEKEWKTYQRWLAKQKAKSPETPKGGGTVGCLCLDSQGHLAAGTSTGGLTGKMFGRVGDTPIIGAGNFADDRTCAVSCSGTGEEFIRHGVARTISNLIAYKGYTVQQAGDELIQKTLKPDVGGAIILGKAGDFACCFNTDGMFRGYANSAGKNVVAIWK
jgi:beta-aspartyl-peptidase (threonine type)